MTCIRSIFYQSHANHSAQVAGMQRSCGAAYPKLQSQVKSKADQERLLVWVEIWTSWPVATWYWTPDIIPVQVRQAAGDVLAVKVIPERMREATCKLSAYHSEGQKRVATVRLSLGKGRRRCGLSADGGRPCPEVPRSVAVSGDAPSIRGEAI